MVGGGWVYSTWVVLDVDTLAHQLATERRGHHHRPQARTSRIDGGSEARRPSANHSNALRIVRVASVVPDVVGCRGGG